MDIEIREACVDDAAAIGAFQTAVWNEAYAGLVRQDYLDSVTVEMRTDRWRSRFGSRRILLACDDGRVVGVASCTHASEPPELNTLYVEAAHRGTGIGGRLLRAAIAPGPAQLWVFEANPAAIRFYERAGFHREGDRVFDDEVGLHEIRLVRG